MTSVLIVSATVGRVELRRCADSIQQQTHSDVRHLVVVDGVERAAGAESALDGIVGSKPLELVVLPRRTGHSGHFGYRIYGALPLLADEDLVLFLDEDNWFDSDHVETCVDTLRTTGASWAYALRRICMGEGEPACDDDCDSLGFWPKLASLSTDNLSPDEAERHGRYPNLVDSSCYALPRELACAVAPLWQSLHADSVVGSHLVQHYEGACTGRVTVNYALGGGSGTPVSWFLDGNRAVRERYGATQLPWRSAPKAVGPGSIPHSA